MSRILGPETSRRVAWKNGLGSTLELASDANVPGGDWTWRLSIADASIAAPFSLFPGVDRFLACLVGPGLSVVRGGAALAVPCEGEAEGRALELAPGSTLLASGRVASAGTAVVCALTSR